METAKNPSKNIVQKKSWSPSNTFIKKKIKHFRIGQFRRTFYTRDMESRGYEVKQLSNESYSVNGRLEIFPDKKLYKDLKTGRVGKIKGSFREFVIYFYTQLI